MTSHSSIFSEMNGQPVCWDWDNAKITQYIQNNQGMAYCRYAAEDPTDETRPQSFNKLLNRVLLPCLLQFNTYAYTDDSQKQVEVCLVSFHIRKHEVPVADVYSALGWFLSYSEDPSSVVSNNAPLFVLYTRLCYNISQEVKVNNRLKGTRGQRTNHYDPAKTHLFWAGTIPILTVHFSDGEQDSRAGDMGVQMSLSATLPQANIEYTKQSNPKGILKASRQQLIRNITGREVADKMTELNSGHFGACAETLNYASFANKDSSKATVGFGFALTTKDVRGRFTSYAEIIGRAHCQPCEACRELFIHGRVTQQDFASGRVCGPFPHETSLPEKWKKRNTPMCKYCHHPITDPRNKTKYCSIECREDYVARRERSQGNYPPTHQVASWNMPQYTPGPSTSIQGYIPATAGYPPSAPQGYEPVTQQWDFYAPPDVNPIPSWARQHPDRIYGNPQYHPPY